ncbi:MAG: hypothetical protein Q8P22_03045, partial [Chloroflexota bacterium]|nr:hypothetical protein [Chloroflexota bacterium]
GIACLIENLTEDKSGIGKDTETGSAKQEILEAVKPRCGFHLKSDPLFHLKMNPPCDGYQAVSQPGT